MIEAYLPVAVLAVFAAIAAWTDVTQRRIPNWLCLACLVAGLALAAWTGGMSALGWHAAHAVIALLIGMALFAIKAIGGGDGKFYPAVASFFPLQQGLLLGAAIGIAGGVLLILFIVWKRTAGRKMDASGNRNMAKLPYGVAIGAGALVLALMG